jgi:hypothetical protein
LYWKTLADAGIFLSRFGSERKQKLAIFAKIIRLKSKLGTIATGEVWPLVFEWKNLP